MSLYEQGLQVCWVNVDYFESENFTLQNRPAVPDKFNVRNTADAINQATHFMIQYSEDAVEKADLYTDRGQRLHDAGITEATKGAKPKANSKGAAKGKTKASEGKPQLDKKPAHADFEEKDEENDETNDEPADDIGGPDKVDESDSGSSPSAESPPKRHVEVIDSGNEEEQPPKKKPAAAVTVSQAVHAGAVIPVSQWLTSTRAV
jgi:hypothetical protein